MSAFDTWVRAGGAGISAPNIMQNVNALNQQKENLTTSQNQNALYQLELAQAPNKQRMATRDDEQKQADYSKFCYYEMLRNNPRRWFADRIIIKYFRMWRNMVGRGVKNCEPRSK